jgi:transposase-like protein
MARIRRNYTPEFQRTAVKLVTELSYSHAAAARLLGLNENLIRSRTQPAETKSDEAIPGQVHYLNVR